MQFRSRARGAQPRGFTLIELMITVAIVAILGALAYPNYTQYVQRSKIIDATSRLSNFRVRMEQQFMDTRLYPDVAACTALIALTDANGANKPFTLTCTQSTNGPPALYQIDAIGNAADNMGGFTYRIDQANVRSTVSVPPGWNPGPGNCWVVRKDGSC